MAWRNDFILVFLIFMSGFSLSSCARDSMSGSDGIERIISVNAKRGILSSNAAIRVAEILILDNYGEGVLNSQVPLYVQDSGEFWIVYSKNSVHLNVNGAVVQNPIYVKIRKLNCEVSSFLFRKLN